jgi:phosphonate transport system substrate-binding protein
MQFGIVSGIKDAPPMFSTLCQELSKHVDERIWPRVITTFPELTALMRSGALDLAWAPPIVAVELELDERADIMLGIWRGAGPTFSSALFVAEDSAVTKVAELRGKSVGWVDEDSASGYFFPRLKLASMGFPPDEFFGKQSFHRTHENVAKAVFDRKVDVGATCVAYYSGTGRVQSAGWLKNQAFTNEQVRILALSGPIPTDAIVVRKTLDERLKTMISKALIKLAVTAGVRDIVRNLFAGDGFVHIDPSHYEQLRGLIKADPSRIRIPTSVTLHPPPSPFSKKS